MSPAKACFGSHWSYLPIPLARAPVLCSENALCCQSHFTVLLSRHSGNIEYNQPSQNDSPALRTNWQLSAVAYEQRDALINRAGRSKYFGHWVYNKFHNCTNDDQHHFVVRHFPFVHICQLWLIREATSLNYIRNSPVSIHINIFFQ